ncbi:MAG: hypothetical protein AAGB31_13810 [Bdellovibrio sp.]
MKTPIKPLALLLVFSLLSLSACQPKDGSTPSAKGKSGSRQTEGGVDSVGGGNGVNNRTFESFAVKVEHTTPFTNAILPLIKKMQDIHPRFASDMAHIALHRKWYILPVKLKTIPAELIGVNFADSKTQQLAVQSLNAVWIDEVLYKKMPSEKEQSRLLLHEIVMGIRLMQYKRPLDQCHSEIALKGLESDKKEYKKAIDQCAMKYLFSGTDITTDLHNGNPVQLTGEDYDNIRELVVTLSDESKTLSRLELEAWLKDRSFRSY